MPSGREIVSTPMSHPVLGPAVAIRVDSRQSWARLFLDLALIIAAVLGLILGLGDLAGNGATIAGLSIPATVLGLTQITGAVIVALWAIRAARVAAGRIRRPVMLVVGRDGFEYDQGRGPVSWSEVESIGDPASPERQPQSLRVQLGNPADYIARHGLSPIDRVVLRLNHHELALGHSSLMPVDRVEEIMRKRLAEFRRVDRARTSAATEMHATTAPKRRRQAKKR